MGKIQTYLTKILTTCAIPKIEHQDDGTIEHLCEPHLRYFTIQSEISRNVF